jgi:LPXTG-motif cell wall-anchored protein
LVAALAPVTAVAAQGSDGTAARPAAAAPLQLPATGSTLSRSLLTFGGGFVIIGAILVIRSRRPLDVRR